MKVVEDSFPVPSGNRDSSFGLPSPPFERFKRIIQCKPVGDKRLEHTLQVLKHAVERVSTPTSVPIFVKDADSMAAGEPFAKPVRNTRLLTPFGKERQLRPVAAGGILSQFLLLFADVISGGLHDGDALFGSGILTGQRIPSLVEFPVDLAAEQCGIFYLLPPTLDAVASNAHTFEFVICWVKDVIADVHLLVPHHLCGSEINEWYCHGGNVLNCTK